MEPCRRCRQAPAVYDCPICRCSFCSECDFYVHSFTSKKMHERHPKQASPTLVTSTDNKYNLTYSYPSLLNTNSSTFRNTNFTSQQQIQMEDPIPKPYQSPKIEKEPNILIYSQSPINSNPLSYKNEDLYDKDTHSDMANMISSLGNKINDTRDDLDQKIDHLHQHFHIMDEKQKTEIIELNYKNLKEINTISEDKDEQIDRLEKIIQDQVNLINELIKNKEKLEQKFQDNNQEINNLFTNKENLLKENKQIENDSIAEIEKLNSKNKEEIDTIKSEYESILETEKTKYDTQGQQYDGLFMENNEYFSKLINEKNREISDIKEQITLLRDLGKNNKDNQSLMKIQNEENIDKIKLKEKEKEALEEDIKRLDRTLNNLKEETQKWKIEASKKINLYGSNV